MKLTEASNFESSFSECVDETASLCCFCLRLERRNPYTLTHLRSQQTLQYFRTLQDGHLNCALAAIHFVMRYTRDACLARARATMSWLDSSQCSPGSLMRDAGLVYEERLSCTAPSSQARQVPGFYRHCERARRAPLRTLGSELFEA